MTPFVRTTPTKGYEHVFVNDRYTVYAEEVRTSLGGLALRLVYLSIKRNDRGVVRDWRDLQAIKNAIVGFECEGVELYPAESRLVDAANQYHLFVVADPSFRWPFGFTEREVSGPVTAGARGARQREFAAPFVGATA
jgi:hypothetical protein